MSNVHSIHARSPIDFERARAQSTQREAELLLCDAQLEWARLQQHKRTAWRTGLAAGWQFGMRTSVAMAFVLGLIFGAAALRALS